MATVTAFVIAGGQSSRMGRDKAFLTLDSLTLLERALAVARSVTDDVRIVGRRELFNSAIPQVGNSVILDNVAIVEDIYPGQGPLAGIHAALKASQSELNLMIGVDTPFLDPRFIEYLVEQATASGATVTVPVTSFQFPVSSFQKSSCQLPVASFQKSGANFPVGNRKSGSAGNRKPETGNSPAGNRKPETGNSPAGNRKLETGNFYQPLCAVYRREFAAIAENALRQRRNNIVPLFAQVATREIDEAEMQRLAFDPRMFDNLNTPEEWEAAQKRLAGKLEI